ncbi:hypothetical protein AMAG_07669 [Allomyces macrogynus ATCC 38327]|uniref:Amino acid transporter transmembrane domain-containing protein n=1 Tax=Allomyces macrogynus (strain ATCC 38327) TaxID=578462 RepID=A0A0L0SIZ5_ALLM3|nr:hypothetical protein AMAG_07669 [Allomyces macrogynus ATCC 38327]|eukprot:KNE62453.1 hypothetical protein AMAG_07669 [Allomyces macrogynus ATCC 38327]
MTAGPDVAEGTASAKRAFLLLIKSFIGTGVLFLPSAFKDGGLTFSIVLLIVLAYFAVYGMLLLVKTNQTIPGSFEEMGGKLYGKVMEYVVLTSVALSQVGFCSAYVLFVANNMVEFLHRVSGGTIQVAQLTIVFVQIGLYMFMAQIRRIEGFAAFSLVGTAFVAFGLIVIAYYSIDNIVSMGGVAKDVVQFNPDRFSLFIGTAVYTFEGIGLVIPISHSMRNRAQFPMVLSLAMTVTVAVYLFMGAIGYLSFGAHVQTIVLFNLPSSNLTSTIYVLYICAIVLSWPLVLFPATVIVENAVLARVRGQVATDRKTGEADATNPEMDEKKPIAAAWSERKIWWAQNVVRAALVLVVGMIAYAAGNALDKLVAIIGGFGCMPLSYVYPAMYHLKVHPEQGFVGRFLDWFLIVVGIASTAYVTWQTFTV